MLCKRQMSHVAIELGHHEQHRHVRLQLACVWLSIARSHWLSSRPGPLACMYLGESWAPWVPKEAFRTWAQIGSGNVGSRSWSSSSGGPGERTDFAWGQCLHSGFSRIAGPHPHAFAQIWILQLVCRLESSGDKTVNFVRKLLQS